MAIKINKLVWIFENRDYYSRSMKLERCIGFLIKSNTTCFIYHYLVNITLVI